RLDNQETLLMWAAGYGSSATVVLLLQHGAQPALRDNRGKTAQDMAREGHFDQTGALLENARPASAP
ncbi:MAG: ankyrin repeat domain-containing protein, partial [Janthinobacterium lividum]